MHPIEHLRYLARTSGLDPATLVREVAYALSSAPFDPAMLVVVGRRLLERHADVGELWWLLSGVMTSPDPQATAWELGERIENDATFAVLADGVPVGARVGIDRWSEAAAEIVARRVDVDVVDPTAIGLGVASGSAPVTELVVVRAKAADTTRVLVGADDLAVAAANDGNVDIWVVCPLGTRLPDQIVAEILARADSTDSAIAVGDIAAVVSADGVTERGAGSVTRALKPDCPLAPELLRRPVG